MESFHCRRTFLVWKFLIAAILCLAVLHRLYYGMLPILDEDYYGYLFPALRGYGVSDARQFLYPLFLSSLLSMFGTLHVVPIVQGAATILSALIIARILLIPSDKKYLCILSCAVSCLVLIAYVFHPAIYITERIIRPEGISPILLAACMWLIATYPRSENKKHVILLIGAVSALCYHVKSTWGFALALPVVVWCMAWLVYRKERSSHLLYGIIGALVVFMPLAVWQGHLENKYDPYESRTFIPKMVFFWHTPGVLKEINTDIERGTSGYKRDLLVELRDMIDAGLLKQRLSPPLAYKSLGFDPEPLLFGPDGLNSVSRFKALGTQGERQFLVHYFSQYIKHNPMDYVAKIATQLKMNYWIPSNAYLTPVCGMYTNWFIDYSIRNMNSKYTLYKENAIMENYKNNLLTKSASNDDKRILCLRPLLKVFNATFVPLVMIWILLCISSMRTHDDSLRNNETFRRLLFIASTCFLCAFLVDLTVAMINSLDTPRFFEFHMLPSLLAQGATTLLTGMFVHDLWGKWKQRKNCDPD